VFASAQKYTCPGVVVEWTPGSVWDSYPYQVHSACSLGWQPIAFSEATNSITIRARNCSSESVQDGGVCKACASLPSSGQFRDFVDRATHVLEFAHWEYLRARQLQAAMRRLSNKRRELQSKVLFIMSALLCILTHFLSCQTQNDVLSHLAVKWTIISAS
jgi:hypothetical protein